MKYIDTPIKASCIVPETRARFDEISKRYGSKIGPRFIETITDDGWFIFDRATRKYFKRLASDDRKAY